MRDTIENIMAVPRERQQESGSVSESRGREEDFSMLVSEG